MTAVRADLTVFGSSGFVDDVGDVFMEALLGHPRVVDPIISGSLASGKLSVQFELLPLDDSD